MYGSLALLFRAILGVPRYDHFEAHPLRKVDEVDRVVQDTLEISCRSQWSFVCGDVREAEEDGTSGLPVDQDDLFPPTHEKCI